MHLHSIPEMQDSAGKVERMRAARDAAAQRLEERIAEVRLARQEVTKADAKVAESTTVLSAARAELAEMLLADKPFEKLQSRVRDLSARIESLQELVTLRTKHADQIDSALYGYQSSLYTAQSNLETAELEDLLVQYAKAIAPAIPLARAIHERAPRSRMSTQLSGYLLNPAVPRIGPYSVNDDGSLYFTSH